MQEPLLLKKKISNNPLLPLAGWNYDTNLSTGNVPVSSTHTAAMLVAPPVAINGYSNVLNNKSQHAFIDNVVRAPGDFTYIARQMLGTTTNYVTMLQWLGVSNGAQLRVADSGFGNRLQPDMNPNQIATCWNVSMTRTGMTSIWNHFAWQRRSGVVTFYINGVLQSLANGVSSSYSATSYSDGTSLAGTTGLLINTSAVAIYTAEWAFWDTAQLSANFTPPAGYLV